MLRTALIASFFLAIPASGSLFAQRGPASGGPRGAAQSVVEPGTMLPDVSVFDEQGEPFRTTALRDGYTVLVFGCLT